VSGWNGEVAAVVPWAVVGLASCAAATVDLRSRRIPNLLTGPLLLAGLIYAALPIPGSPGLGNALVGLAFAGLPFFLLWMVRGSGAGDAKLMFGVGAWLAWPAALPATLSIAICGGILSVLSAVSKGRLGASLAGLPRAMLAFPFVLCGPGRLADRQQMAGAEMTDNSAAAPQKVPYGVAIFVGSCLAAAWCLWLRNAWI
jgi:prepilin peptidase CpaA